MIIGTLSAITTGVLLPLFSILSGQLADTFDPKNTPEDIKQAMNVVSAYIALLGFGTWLFAYIYFSFWQHVAENIAFNLRVKYLKAILQQEVEYLESINIEQLPSQIGENFTIIQEAIGQKFSTIIFAIFNLISAMSIALARGADLAAIFLVVFPIMFMMLLIFGAQVKKGSILKSNVIRKLGGIVEESLMSIRLITSFAQQDKEIERFNEISDKCSEVSDKAEFWVSGFLGFLKFAIYGFYSFNFWLGTIYIEHKKINPNTGSNYTVGEIISIIVALMNCSSMTFQLNPNLQAIVKAKLVGRQIFDVIDRVPQINDSDQSISQFQLNHCIKFQNVSFTYSKSKKQIIKDATFQIRANESTAIVGHSGCGKSTIIQLIERFYNTKNGNIFLDEINIKNIKLKTLRESIGYVQQEPVLLMGSIKDNILFGNKDATDEELDQAIMMANASFIYQLENKLDTQIGSSNILNLSGGQKQRIAIARALIKHPKILILDEATSALDPKSERDVQTAFNNIQSSDRKLTTIMIAHRLQTIMSAENLIYLDRDYKIFQASKGSQLYDEIMGRLQNEQVQEEQQDIDSPSPLSKKKNENFYSDLRIENHEQSFYRLNTNRDMENSEAFERSQNTINPITQSDEVSNDTMYGIGHVMNYYRPYSKVFVQFLATLGSAFSFPLYGFIFSKIVFVMLNSASDNFINERNLWCSCFVGLSVAMGCFDWLNKSLSASLCETMTNNIRKQLYAAIIRKNIGWFDNKTRAPGILSNMIQEDISQLKGLTSQTYSSLLEAILCLGIGVVLSFIYTWKMALVALAISPLIIAGGIAQQLIIWNSAKNSNKQSVKDTGKLDPYDKANALLSDIIINYRTVLSFGEKNIEFLIQKYDDLLEEPKRIGIKSAHISGFFYGYTTCIRFLFIAFVFYMSSIFIFEYNDKPEDTYIGVYTLFVAALGTGTLLSQMPSVNKAKKASQKIFSIINDMSNHSDSNHQEIRNITNGQIEFKDVTFRYPSRQQKVLNKLSFKVPAASKIAIVGHSGCGKSTIATLLLQLYEFSDGQIFIDGIDIKDYNVKSLRQQIGYVMQEPLLFNMSIKENILYGNENATDEQIREAAEMANALQFIENSEDSSHINSENSYQQTHVSLKKILRFPNFKKNYCNLLPHLKESFKKVQDDNQQLRLILEIIKRADQNLMMLINIRPESFIKSIQTCLKQDKSVKWQDIVLNFEWKFQASLIKAQVNQIKMSSNFQKQILEALKTKKNQFDIQTIKSYQAQIVLNPEEIGMKSFEEVINADYDRIKHQNDIRISSLVYNLKQKSKFKKKSAKIQQLDETSIQSSLHPGFNKICGLKGSMLSGGQKQRIAIARALIKDPKIMILDEATSALDEQSQECVQKALDRAMEGRTSIVIAHRLSTIKNCEWILVLHHGKVIEQGTFQSLLENENSYFNKLKSGMEM
ncbi:abc transporter [Stylonychia lemnae]|uniref:Abc transporter n=1 Tax=Stylonychia lemnae TaxID=5949 RepID=A0A078B501_STYLE|nr:abc transporter [Stylonychia lemnae]|eukprot:CDW89499.1 abc transporter [Stylonychia lemnae]